MQTARASAAEHAITVTPQFIQQALEVDDVFRHDMGWPTLHAHSVAMTDSKDACLQENISAFDVDLPEEAFNEINEVFKRYRDPAVR